MELAMLSDITIDTDQFGKAISVVILVSVAWFVLRWVLDEHEEAAERRKLGNPKRLTQNQIYAELLAKRAKMTPEELAAADAAALKRAADRDRGLR